MHRNKTKRGTRKRRIERPLRGVLWWDEILRRMARGLSPLPPGAAWRSVPFIWRTRALDTGAPRSGRFEQTLTPCSKLDVPQNYDAFRDKLRAAPRGALCIRFPNLSGDTTLVVPTPPRRGRAYTTLRDFLRHAPVNQQQALWREVARAARDAVRRHGRVWISTHGLGVAFLHVRLCAHPKYYGQSRLATE